MIATYWKQLRPKLKARDGVSYNFGYAASPGVYTIEAFHRDFPMPLCVVWFNIAGHDRVQILNSFTFEHARRSGLRTYLHERLRAAYPDRTIMTMGATRTGAAWMKAVGYKKTAAGWESRPKRVAKKSRRAASSTN